MSVVGDVQQNFSSIFLKIIKAKLLLKVTLQYDKKRFPVSNVSSAEEELKKAVDFKMATAAQVENLMTCGVCRFKYDYDNRKPKFLQCTHTVCLLCLEVIVK